MEKPKQPLHPLDQLDENYSLSLNVYKSLVTQGETDEERLSLVSESVDEARQYMRSSVNEVDRSTISPSSQLLQSFNVLFSGKLDPDNASQDPFLEEFLFSFPSRFRDAFGFKD